MPVRWRKGTALLQLSAEITLKHYHDGMGGANHVGQHFEMGAGFASKSHYKKWYKQVFFSICKEMRL